MGLSLGGEGVWSQRDGQKGTQKNPTIHSSPRAVWPIAKFCPITSYLSNAFFFLRRGPNCWKTLSLCVIRTSGERDGPVLRRPRRPGPHESAFLLQERHVADLLRSAQRPVSAWDCLLESEGWREPLHNCIMLSVSVASPPVFYATIWSTSALSQQRTPAGFALKSTGSLGAQ